jgi:hypothetical protein
MQEYPGTLVQLGGDCTDNSCPAIWRDQQRDDVIVRGEQITGVDRQTGEEVVRVPAQMFRQAADAMPPASPQEADA